MPEDLDSAKYCHLGCKSTDVSEELAASIFRVEDGGGTFLLHIGKFIPK
jgi:hypothetical protein